MDEKKLIDIETKLAHQEHLLGTLNEALTNQQAQITYLQELCRALVDRMRAMADTGGEEAQTDERPPHY